MNDKEKEFIERVKCGIAYCEDIPIEIEQKTIRKDGDGTMCDLLNQEIEELTKKNEIEEIAKEIQKSVDGCANYWAKLIATYLYEQGYRNCKDKVVLDKEEYDDLLCRVPRSEVDRVVDMVEQQVRQETAREILQTIKSYDGWNELQRLRDEIAEEYGVEVE